MKNFELFKRSFTTVFMALLTGCTADATQFMLLIESNLEVETELTKVQLTVNWQNEPGQSPSTLVEEIRLTQSASISSDKNTLPLTVAVVPRPEKLDGNVRFFVEAFGPVDTSTGAPIGRLFSREVRTSFVPNQRKILQIFLARRCLSEDCKNGTTCTENGCVSPVINSADLPNVNDDSPVDIKIENRTPSQPVVRILDGEPFVVSTTTLTCKVTTDSVVPSDDSYLPMYEYQWSRKRQGEWQDIGDATPRPTDVPNGQTRIDDSWKCSVTALFEDQRSASGTAEVKVRAPFDGSGPGVSPIELVSIVRSNPCGTVASPLFSLTSGELTCQPVLRSGVSQRLTYGWRVGDGYRAREESVEVNLLELVGGEEVRCRVCVGNFIDTDGNSPNCEDSPPVTANMRPEKPSLTLTSTGTYSNYHFSGEELQCDLEVSGPQTYYLTFKREVGTSTVIQRTDRTRSTSGFTASEFLDSSFVSGGDSWSCSAYVQDECGDYSDAAYARADILRDDLIGYWPLDSDASAGTDITGNFPSPQAIGVQPATDRKGKEASISFAATNASITTRDSNLLLPNRDEYTMCAWVYPESAVVGASVPKTVFSQSLSGSAQAYNDGFGLFVNPMNQLVTGQNTNQDWSVVYVTTSTANVVFAEQWSHVCSRYDRDYLAIYLNGRRIASAVLRGSTAGVAPGAGTGDPLFIGSDRENNHFRGRIDDVKFWNTALPETEICRQAENRGCIDWVISSYAGLEMSKTEITVKTTQDWLAQTGIDNPDFMTANVDDNQCNYKPVSGGTDYDDHPVNCINYDAANALCGFFGSRLPYRRELLREKSATISEVERTFPWGNDEPSCDKLIMSGCGFLRSQPACSKEAGNSASELCDLAGNVAEWTLSTTITVGSNTVEETRVVGGHFDTPASDTRYFSLQDSDSLMKAEQRPTVGLRCVKPPLGSRNRAAKSCHEIFVEYPQAKSGHFWLDDDKEEETYSAYYAYCQKKGDIIITWVKRTDTIRNTSLYYMRNEATVEQFAECVDEMACSRSNFDERSVSPPNNLCNYSDRSDERFDFPMNCLEYNGAQEFCRWVGGEIPSEEQWLAEGRFSDAIPTPWGTLESTCDRVIMTATALTPPCNYTLTESVCSKPNGNSVSGACDMWGNVKEWVRKPTTTSLTTNVLGGSFDDDLSQVQTGNPPQSISTPRRCNSKEPKVGFRCIHEGVPQGDDQNP